VRIRNERTEGGMSMELIDQIMNQISNYVIDPMAVSNCLYIAFQDYSITRKQTELTEYVPDSNDILIKKFLVVKKIKGCTDRTLHYYQKELPRIFERIGKNALDVKVDDIRLWIALRLRDGISATTIGNEKRVLSSFFTWLHGEDIIHKNPMVAIDTMKQRKTQKEAFKDDEVVAMRNQLTTSREKAIFELLLSTGCRVSELVGIKLDEIQEDFSILVHGKGQKDRYVYMNANAKFAYQQYINDRKDNSIWLFPRMISIQSEDFRKGKGMKSWYKNPKLVNEAEHADKGTIEFIVRKWGKKCNVKAYPHKFRRTCATNALRNGMPIEMVSRMLGHQNIGTTQIYLDLNDDQMKMMHERYVR
jgi:site-specific recombinase XerD